MRQASAEPSVVPMEPRFIASFRAAVDSVARERRFLALLEAPPLGDTEAFVHGHLRDGSPHVVAVVDEEGDERVVGWCDVSRGHWPSLRHGGTLGIGVVRGFRGRGLGMQLLRAALAAAGAAGLRRVDLTVRVDNEPARRLYERCGFAVEGRLRGHMQIDGVFYDTLLMSLWLPDAAGEPSDPR